MLDWKEKHRSRPTMVKRHMHTLKIQAMMIGLQVYHKILFLDVETIVCASLHSFFFTVDSQRSQVAFVPVSKGHFYGRDIVARVFDIPTNFPEAKAEIMVVRNGSATHRLLANWNLALYFLSRHDSLLGQHAFRASLFHSGVGYSKLPVSSSCFVQEPLTKLAPLLACPTIVKDIEHRTSTYRAIQDCAVLHSRELSSQSTQGPIGLPNFFSNRGRQLMKNDSAQPHNPNYNLKVLSGLKLLKTRAKDLKPDDATYRNAPTVFLHIPKAAGNSVKKLFVKGFLLEQRNSQQLGAKIKMQSLHIDTRRDWDIKKQAKHPYAVLFGAFAFGACASHPQAPCAYYVVLREPVARILSEHKYCHAVDFEDQCCAGSRGAVYMRTLNIAQWAEEKGNFMLEHFLQLVPEDWYQISTNYYVPWRQRDRETRINPIENRRVREGPANIADLRFVKEHLEDWFAVIGITERFEESMMLFAFALTGESIPKNMVGSVHTHNQNTSVSGVDAKKIERVNAAVTLDTGLYHAAFSLFEKQLVQLEKYI